MTETNIYQRILKVMAELKYIQKGAKKVNGQYSYVSHDQVTAAIHPLLVKHGIVIIPSIEETTQDGNRTTVKMLVYFINADKPEDHFTMRSLGYGIDTGDKGPGKAVSYAFKMACLKAFCLETGEDPDHDQNACYEPEKCQGFDSLLMDLTDKERVRAIEFLEASALSFDKHIEDLKRDAVKRPEEFLAAFKKWNTKRKDK